MPECSVSKASGFNFTGSQTNASYCMFALDTGNECEGPPTGHRPVHLLTAAGTPLLCLHPPCPVPENSA